MGSTANEKEFYFIGGTMSPDARSYVVRRADTELFEGLLAGEFCYVLTPRQMGKSSLMVRTARKLRQAGTSVAVLDLTAVGQNITAEQWYAGLLLQIGQRLNLEDELLEFWPTAPELGPLQRWMKAIQTILLPAQKGRIVIFIDEIDTVRSLPFKTDEFFAGIRECYNLRSEVPEINRLSFCLLGVATPSDLISNPFITPFNIGRRIELHDFEAQEAMSLADGLRQAPEQNRKLLRRMLYWTGGHPYLTQRLCQSVARADDVKTPRDVDRVCNELFFTRRAREQDDNLLFVRDRILRTDGDLAGLLSLYDKIRKGRRVRDDETNVLLSTLQLSGITRVEEGCLKVRNRIYEELFNRHWVRNHFPNAERRRQRIAFFKGAAGIAALGLVILGIIGWFYWRAHQEGEIRQSLLYFRQVGLAWQEYDVNANIDRTKALLLESLPQPGQRDLRSVEWYQLWYFTHRDLWDEPRRGDILATAFSRDGKSILTAHLVSKNGAKFYQVQRLDAGSRGVLKSFDVPAGANFMPAAFSPDSSLFAADSPNDRITVWDVESGQLKATYDSTGSPLTLTKFSPDGRWLAAGNLRGNIGLIDLVNGRHHNFHSNQNLRIVSIAFSPDSRQMMVADTSNTLRGWELARGTEISPFVRTKESFEQVALLPASPRLMTSDASGKLSIWDLGLMQPARELPGHIRSIRAIAASPDERILATSSLDKTVRLWSMKSWRELGVIKGHGSSVNTLAWAPDSCHLLTGSISGSLKLWDIRTTSPLQYPEEHIKSIFATRFGDRGEPIAFGTTPAGEMKIWDLSTGAPLVQLNSDERGASFASAKEDHILYAAFSPKGTLLATGGTHGLIKLWDTANGRLLRSFDGCTNYIYNIIFSPDGEKLISGGKHRLLCIWETATGKFLGEIGARTVNDYRVAISPSGNLIATARNDGGIDLWSFPQLANVQTLPGNAPPIGFMAFSPGSDLLAAADRNNKIILWDIHSGKKRLTIFSTDSIQRLLFSPDGLRLVSGSNDGTVKLWDVQSGQEVFTYRGHSGQITSFTFGHDRKSLLTSSQDGTIQYWPSATEEEVAGQLEQLRKSEPTP